MQGLSTGHASAGPGCLRVGVDRNRKTQVQKSAETRELLLEATIEVLFKVGYARLTTTAVCEQAGLSRGAQVYHFPNKWK